MDYVPHTDKDKQQMLAEMGVGSAEELFQIIPEALRKPSFNIPGAISEQELIASLKELSKKNCNLGE